MTLSPLERALLTRNWDVLAEEAKEHRSAELGPAWIAWALTNIRGSRDLASVVDEAPSESRRPQFEAARYLGDVARWKRGDLDSDRGQDFGGAFRDLHRDDVVTIGTIQKSGTHWMRFFITNYARILADPSVRRPVSYMELLDNYYGNNRWQVFREAEKYREPAALLRSFNISDVAMQHFRADFDPLVFTPGPKIMLFRNPLDYVVSLYYYNIKQRSKNRHKADHPRDVMVPMLEEYCRHFVALSSYRRHPEALIAAYEDLKRDPWSNFKKVITFLKLPYDEDAVERALEMSDIKAIRALEERDGHSMVVRMDGYFTRDGSIGQWKRFFGDADIERASGILGSYSIDLDSFVVEA